MTGKTMLILQLRFSSNDADPQTVLLFVHQVTFSTRISKESPLRC